MRSIAGAAMCSPRFFCLAADPRLGGVWTFDLWKHSSAKGPGFLQNAKPISVFICVQEHKHPNSRVEPGTVQSWAWFRVRNRVSTEMHESQGSASNQMGCRVHNGVRDVTRFGCRNAGSARVRLSTVTSSPHTIHIFLAGFEIVIKIT